MTPAPPRSAAGGPPSPPVARVGEAATPPLRPVAGAGGAVVVAAAVVGGAVVGGRGRRGRGARPLGHPRRQVTAHEGVGGVAGAGRLGHVAVPRDRGGLDRGPRRPAVRTAGRERGRGTRCDVDALPPGQPGQHAGQGLDGLGRRLIGHERPDQAHELGEALVAPGGVADDRPVDAACPALPHPPEPVDEEVVGHVGPALVGAGVQCVELPDLVGRLLLAVVVGGGAVVDEQHADVAGPLGRQTGRCRQVGAPRLAPQHRHPWRHLHGDQRQRLGAGGRHARTLAPVAAAAASATPPARKVRRSRHMVITLLTRPRPRSNRGWSSGHTPDNHPHFGTGTGGTGC